MENLIPVLVCCHSYAVYLYLQKIHHRFLDPGTNGHECQSLNHRRRTLVPLSVAFDVAEHPLVAVERHRVSITLNHVVFDCAKKKSRHIDLNSSFEYIEN